MCYICSFFLFCFFVVVYLFLSISYTYVLILLSWRGSSYAARAEGLPKTCLLTTTQYAIRFAAFVWATGRLRTLGVGNHTAWRYILTGTSSVSFNIHLLSCYLCQAPGKQWISLRHFKSYEGKKDALADVNIM